MNDDTTDLDQFGADCKARHAVQTKVDDLADGEYDVEILEAAMDRVNADRVLRIDLKVQDGPAVEWVHWLSRQTGVNSLLADLLALGFDADKWGPAFKRPLSVEVPKAVAKLRGLKFRAIKTHRAGTGQYAGKVYHDFRASCKLDGRAAPPRRAAAPAADDGDIPF